MADERRSRTARHKILVGAGIVGALVLGVLAKESVRSYFDRARSQDLATAEVLNKAASAINSRLPMMVDKDTEATNAVAFEGVLVYNYRLVHLSVEEVNPNELLETLRPSLTNAACTTPQTRDTFLSNGVSLRYSYYDREKSHIGFIEISPEDCDG